MATRELDIDANGDIALPALPKAIVRFPTEAEQAQGMNEVPRATRLIEGINGNKI